MSDLTDPGVSPASCNARSAPLFPEDNDGLVGRRAPQALGDVKKHKLLSFRFFQLGSQQLKIAGWKRTEPERD